MKERPIIFSGEMVRAILDGRKTQTRRIVKPQPPAATDGRWSWIASSSDKSEVGKFRYSWTDKNGTSFTARGRESGVFIRCPHGEIGDRLWVRENFFCITGEPGPVACNYQSDYANGEFKGMWKPSIHMPRWASRITLEIKGVRVERLQDISQADAILEGIASNFMFTWMTINPFKDLWQSIHGPGSWSANPWVWVIEFERIK